MAKVKRVSIGIEYDNLGIRAAKVTAIKKGKLIHYNIDKLVEERGTFEGKNDLVEGLKKIRSSFSIGQNDYVTTCVSGKQMHVTQMPFKLLPENEMESALRFEVRKSLPFEATGSTIDYQVMRKADRKDQDSQLLVTTVANILLNKHVDVLQKSGIKPMIVDVLPVTVANVFWRERTPKDDGSAYVMIHLGPGVCTVVIDGRAVPFYTRSIYFSSEEIFGEKTEDDKKIGENERERRLVAFGEELKRSLSFYEKAHSVSNFAACYVLGEYIYSDEVFNFIREKLQLETKHTELALIAEKKNRAKKGKFDVAIALGMR